MAKYHAPGRNLSAASNAWKDGNGLIKSLTHHLNNMRNPFFRVKRCFSRYLIITCITGTLSFLVALVLLHSGMKPFLTLVLSVSASGLLNYAMLELWAFPHRRGRLSWRRLIGNAMVGLGGFAARWGVLTIGLKYLGFLAPFDKAAPLLFAYCASFAIGFLLRSRVVFRRNPDSCRAPGISRDDKNFDG